MKSIGHLLSEYGVSHQNPINKRVHWVCVPAIVFSLLGVLWLLPVPGDPPSGINWATVLIVIAMIYYVVVAPKLAAGMIVYVGLNIVAILALQATALPLLYVYMAIFVIAWIGQFVGHVIEGRRPSFFQDIQFLLIGPLRLLAFLYRRWGWGY